MVLESVQEKTLTLMFTDIEASTSLVTQRGTLKPALFSLAIETAGPCGSTTTCTCGSGVTTPRGRSLSMTRASPAPSTNRRH